MNILNKYLFHTIKEKLFRQFLMLFAIIISTALLILSLSVVDLLTDIYLQQAVEEYGDYNIKIKEANGAVWNLDDIEELKDITKLSLLESAGYVINASDKEFMVLGVDYEEFENYSPMKPIETNFSSFDGQKVFISTKVASSLNVEINDIIPLFTDGQEKDYTVVGIYENEGLFKYDGEEAFSVIVPKENLAMYNNDHNNCTTVLGCVDKNSVVDWSNQFNENNDLICTQNYDEVLIKGQFEWIQTPLIFMLIITLMMSTFIISCTFKVIVNERLPIFGTFFSQGATYGQVNRLLLKEGIIYGMFGGLLGCVAGYYLTQFVSNYSVFGMNIAKFEKYSVNTIYYLIGFLFAIILSSVTVLFTVRSIKKMQLKEVILNLISTIQSNRKQMLIVGIVCVCLTAIMSILEEKVSYVLSIPCVCIFLVGAIILIPYIIMIICVPIAKFFRGKSIVAMLAFQNVATTTILKNNITLIAVCIMSITIISSLSASITDVINGSYHRMNFDVCANINISKSEEFGEKLYLEFPDSEIYTVGSITSYLDDDTLKAINMYYVDTENYAGFDDYMEFENKEKQLAELNEIENGIILSKRMAKTYGIKQGDFIKLAVSDSTYEMLVTSIVDCKMYASGNYNIISKKTAETMFSYDNPTQYYIQTDLSKEDVKDKLKGYGAEIIDKDDLIEDSENEMKQFIDILSVFSYIMMIMAAFGIISNVMISFIQRKKEMAVYTSLGMSNYKKVALLLLESLFMTLLGIILGVVIGGISLVLIADVFTFLMLDLTLEYNVKILFIVSIATIVLVLLMFIPLIRKFMKINVIKELKFE